MKQTILLFLSCLLTASLSYAAEQATPTVYSNVRLFKMCDAEDTTGTCDSAAGVDLYAAVLGYNQFTITFSQTSGGNDDAFCDIYIGDQDLVDTITPTSALLSTDGTKINSTTLSLTSTAQSFEGPFNIMWIICTEDTETARTHTVRILASRTP